MVTPKKYMVLRHAVGNGIWIDWFEDERKAWYRFSKLVKHGMACSFYEKNKAGNYDIVRNDAQMDLLGADFVNLDPKKAKEYGIKGGVVVKKISSTGALNDQTRMKDGFIILKVNDKDINSVDEMRKIVGSAKSITISGFYPGYDGLYEYPITLE